MLSPSYNIISDHGFSVTEHGREVVDGLNTTYKRFLLQLMNIVQLYGYKGHGNHMDLHSSTHNSDISLARELQKYLSNELHLKK